LYQVKSWNQARRVVAKVEWHNGELFLRAGFIVTNLTRPAKRVVRFYHQRGTAEPWIKEGKNAVKWTRLSCHDLVDNQVRRQLFVLALPPGQLPAAGGGAPLDTDDVAGETDQDWGKSRAPFLEERFPDGGSGGSASVVPGHSGKDWAAEIGNGVIRMKEETQPSQGNTGNTWQRGFHLREKKGHGIPKWRQNASRAGKKPKAGWKKRLANPWSRKIITPSYPCRP
jgi:hypothetical protein